ncbi:TonB-dependent receptor [Tenacibaculum retecalamus]|uniref:TonB-dependent receptor n=1 Tax=Tenacibaculum retecalamus TaxID=3018315 RepID=UPI0023D94848|nr:TonB-dependent receptor [Tenacibaculum retecalamus]WBX71119.1 carboxypeptidase-like regulatory domain-containing protein [Tenacibaculum retecalamus]
MKNFKNVLLIALFFVTATVLGQTKLTGTVVDEMGEPLPGANLVVKGTTNGAATDFNGKFILDAKLNSGTVIVSFIGYIKKEVAYLAGKTKLGTIELEPSNVLDEIVVVGSGVIDLAEGRKTPVAVSTIRATEIQAKAGAWDLPEVLKSTPSVQAVKGGGFGEGQMYLRGFDQTNTAFLLNGQPINGMEDGKMYWSNWAGVMDVANAVQVQRGLGSSKLAISSVGGTVNIVTKTIDKKEGGYVRQMVGNNGYTKSTVSYSTGVSEKGWSFTGLFGHWQGDGYVDNTHGAGQTYFLSLGYQPNENNTFNFMLTGAPQSHATAGRGDIKDFLDKGIRFNDYNYDNVDSPNTLGNSNVYPRGRNIYHKPVANLSWDLTINEKSSLSSVLYGSMGRGAFVSTYLNNDGEGYGRGSNNNHNWFGLVSNYNNELNENFKLNVGVDVRTYNGIHYRSANEFIGVNSVTVNDDPSDDEYSTYIGEAYDLTDTYGGVNPWSLLFNSNDDHRQRLGYDYEEVITYYGLFGQIEYSKDALSAFFQGAVSNQDHQREEFMYTQNVGVSEKSKKLSNLGYNVKAGVAYDLNENNKVFFNAGYYSRQPYHDDLFLQDRKANDFAPNVDNQEIIGLELGYQFKSEFVSANLNVYNTQWDNRTISGANREIFDTPLFRSYKTQGVKQVHRGAELELFTKPLTGLRLNGFISYGDWKYEGTGTQREYNNVGTLLGTSEVDVDGYEVGGGAQTTAGVSAIYTVLPRFTVDANWNFYDRLFSDGQFTDAPVEVPSYNLTDIGMSFKPKLKKGTYIKSLEFRVGVDNVFDTLYIERLQESRPDNDPSNSWNGVNTNNRGRFGYGRTWNASLKFNF